MKKITLTIFAFIVFLTATKGQNSLGYTPLDSLTFDGISGNMAFLKKDKIIVEGYYNILRIDTNTKAISVLNVPQLTQNFILLGNDNAGKLVILNQDTLLLFNDTTWVKTASPIHFSAVGGSGIDSLGFVFLFDKTTNKAYRYNGFVWATYFSILNANETNPSYWVSGNKNIYVVCQSKSSSGFYRYKKFTGAGFTLIDSIQYPPFYIDATNRVWYKPAANKIGRRLPNHTVTTFTVPVNYFYYNPILNKAGSKIWCWYDDGLLYFNGSVWDTISTKAGFISYQANDEVWMNSNNVLLKFKGNKLIKTFYNTSANSIGINSILCNRDYGYNNVMTGTNNGINIYQLPNFVKNINTTNSTIVSNKILCFNQPINHTGWGSSYYDTLLIGTDAGLMKCDINSQNAFTLFHHYTKLASGILSDTITAIFHQIFSPYTNAIWLGTNQGLSIIKSNGTVVNYTSANSILPSNHINKIVEKYNDTILYICTDSGFVTADRTGCQLLQSFTTANSGLNHSDVRDIIFRNYYIQHGSTYYPHSQTWIATMGGGLNLIDTDLVWKYYNTVSGNFISDSIGFIQKTSYSNSYSEYFNYIGTTDKGIITSNDVFDSIQQQSYSPTTSFINSFGHTESKTKMITSSYSVSCFEGCCDHLAILSNGGILSNSGCWGGIEKINSTTTSFKCWFNGNNLEINWSKLNDGAATVQLYDVMGRKVFETKTTSGNKRCTAVVNDLNNAIYLVRVQQNQNTQSGKIVWMK